MSMQTWSLLVVVCFWCWAAALGLFIARAFPIGRGFDARQATLWGGLALFFASCWAFGCTMA
ncbi:hypothetical protein [Trichlorobacter sp.]|uniref:hypothetical protein n=1 Tax=Trichlorobacter sp. TaxID=2911007 RepID=UPI002A3696FA|nr:hypothetical protein [Trichlorobacter sp.]MDY0384508.1 hypothetical protein [Trichlorobacter sp.]